jgi:hypothetical protein
MLHDYLEPEAKARFEIDKMLAAAGWTVQGYKTVNLGASQGVAVREFVMADGRESADYLLFVDRQAVGVIEAKKAGTTLTGVEWQSAKYLLSRCTEAQRSVANAERRCERLRSAMLTAAFAGHFFPTHEGGSKIAGLGPIGPESLPL